MTCIVGLEHNNKVYIGGDSASCGNWDIAITRLPKVFRTNGFLIGYSGSFRMGQLLQYKLEVRERGPDEDDMTYMVCGFAEAIRKCLKEYGFAKVENNEESFGKFLVGYKSKLYLLDYDLQVNSFYEGLYAIGCGSFYAMGALEAIKCAGSIDHPEVAIRQVLEISAKYSNGVRGPFEVLSVS